MSSIFKIIFSTFLIIFSDFHVIAFSKYLYDICIIPILYTQRYHLSLRHLQFQKFVTLLKIYSTFFIVIIFLMDFFELSITNLISN